MEVMEMAVKGTRSGGDFITRKRVMCRDTLDHHEPHLRCG